MELTTSRLILRDLLPSDWTDIHEYAKDPEFSQYDLWGPNSEADTKKFVDEKIQASLRDPRIDFALSVVDKTSFKVIGGCSLRRASDLSVVGDVGYAINPKFQRQGFATEAVQAMFHFGFHDLKLQVIWATCDVQNPSSYRVMEKSRMKRVGHLLRFKEFKGAWHDSYRYEITRAEFLIS